MRAIARLFGIISIAFSCLAYAGTWSPIAGIPEPAFGVIEEPPALPSPWDQEVSGLYYVCNSCPGAGDVASGTPSSPRRSLPKNVSSGAIIVLAGINSGIKIDFNCDAAAPCFLIADPANPPVANGDSEISGRYYIIDGVHAHLPLGMYAGTIRLRGDHGAFRNGRITGNSENGGASTSGSDILILDNEIMDNGDVNASFDQDRHGIKVFGNNIWVIGNEIARNSGDGVQVADTGTLGQVHHIYIGKNISHGNKQTGFWVKDAEHVIISENTSYNHVPSGSSSGEGMGAQYDFKNVWFLFNEIYDNRTGIGIKSSNNGGGSGLYLVGNYIHDIDSRSYDPNDAWSSSSLTSWNSADITIVNNSIDDSTTGITLNGNTGSAYIYNNAITGMQHPNAKAIFAADPSDIQYEGFNTEDGESEIDSGTAPITEKDPYAIFQRLYGMNIAVDIEGNRRPNKQWDTGAFESQVDAGPRPMPPVLESEE